MGAVLTSKALRKVSKLCMCLVDSLKGTSNARVAQDCARVSDLLGQVHHNVIPFRSSYPA